MKLLIESENKGLLKKGGLLQACPSQADSGGAASGQELRSRWILCIKDADLARR